MDVPLALIAAVFDAILSVLLSTRVSIAASVLSTCTARIGEPPPGPPVSVVPGSDDGDSYSKA
jgi:hypothetical protein